MIHTQFSKFIILLATLFICIGPLTSFVISSDQENTTKHPEKITEAQTNTSGKSNIDFTFELIGIIVVFAVVFLQINRQHKSNLKLQKENFRDKLKLQIFKEIGEKISISIEHYTKVSSLADLIVMKIDTNLFLQSEGITPKPLSERMSTFQDSHYEFNKSLVDLVYILEKYLITDQIFKIFCMAIQSSIYEQDKAFQPFNETLLKLLPIDVPKDKRQHVGTDVILPKNPSAEKVSALKRYSSQYNEKLSDLLCYLHDLQTETQNLLLGGIFESKISPRKPQNNKYVVVSNRSTRSIKQLQQYFMYETE